MLEKYLLCYFKMHNLEGQSLNLSQIIIIIKTLNDVRCYGTIVFTHSLVFFAALYISPMPGLPQSPSILYVPCPRHPYCHLSSNLASRRQVERLSIDPRATKP